MASNNLHMHMFFFLICFFLKLITLQVYFVACIIFLNKQTNKKTHNSVIITQICLYLEQFLIYAFWQTLQSDFDCIQVWATGMQLKLLKMLIYNIKENSAVGWLFIEQLV